MTLRRDHLRDERKDGREHARRRPCGRPARLAARMNSRGDYNVACAVGWRILVGAQTGLEGSGIRAPDGTVTFNPPRRGPSPRCSGSVSFIPKRFLPQPKKCAGHTVAVPFLREKKRYDPGHPSLGSGPTPLKCGESQLARRASTRAAPRSRCACPPSASRALATWGPRRSKRRGSLRGMDSEPTRPRHPPSASPRRRGLTPPRPPPSPPGAGAPGP